MRPIDADALNIDREHFDTYADYSCAFDMIDNAPTIDAVPVIRCKDCKWYYRGGATCVYWDGENGMRSDDYCSQAERKEE